MNPEERQKSPEDKKTPKKHKQKNKPYVLKEFTHKTFPKNNSENSGRAFYNKV